ncbi:MAG TPA: dTDP-4-dehydrorhamnose 3,5-epimerase [Candidatus Paenibacillus intestinavium]|nr:dTDP-4-dehydrorhamnose 3,5-epimerase [Candidatus Paenibacillus intestinavium]
MKVLATKLAGIKLIEPTVYGDNRGFFMESYNKETFNKHGIHTIFVQDNLSLSAEAGVLRGLHYQLNPAAQTKLIRVISGEIIDVVVDIRRNSPTFGQWEGFVLSADNKRQLLVPRGFAHGFCTQVANTEVQYKVDSYYSPEHDRGIAWDDVALHIDWPTSSPILSEKDRNQPRLAEAEINFEYEG